MRKEIKSLYDELEVIKYAILLAERPDILEQVKAVLDENTTN